LQKNLSRENTVQAHKSVSVILQLRT